MYQSGSVLNMAALMLWSALCPTVQPDLKRRNSRGCPIAKLGAVPPEIRKPCPKRLAVADRRVDQVNVIHVDASLRCMGAQAQAVRLDNNSVGILQYLV